MIIKIKYLFLGDDVPSDNIVGQDLVQDLGYPKIYNFWNYYTIGSYPREKIFKIFSGNDPSRVKNMRGIRI
jgi:hypothetical protein